MIIRVKIAELAVRRESGLLLTSGLGSCVGVVLYDPVRKIGGMTHILLADSTMFNPSSLNLLKYADTALPLMLDKMLREGALKKELVAKIAGGSHLFNYKKISSPSKDTVGERNILAVKKTLKELKIPLRGEDVGGNFGRAMKFYVDTGKVIITSYKGQMKEF